MKMPPVSKMAQPVGGAWSSGARTVRDLGLTAADRIVPSRRKRAARRMRLRDLALVVGVMLLVGAVVALRLRRNATTGAGTSPPVTEPSEGAEHRTAMAGA